MKGIVSRNCGDHVEVSINYCPLCGVELSQYDEEILLAKQRYYEDKLSEIKYHLGRIRTTSVESIRPKFTKRTPVVEEAINVATKIYEEMNSENEGEK